MERILLTGGAGYVGSACCVQLLRRGFRPQILDDFSTGFREAVPEGVTAHRIDFGDAKALAALLARQDYDVIFHFAAKALVAESMANPGIYFSANVASAVQMLEMLRKYGIRKFVFSSSAAVYGCPEIVPTPENHPKNPVNAYGESKLLFEQILKWYVSAYHWSVVVFRYFNACGGGSNWGERHHPETHVIPLILQTASGRRKHFDVYGTDYPTPDGTCLRDYVHVMDIAEAHILALQKLDDPGFHVYNIGTGTSYSVREVCDAAARIAKTKVETRSYPRRAGDPPILCASPAKLMNEFRWQPKHSNLDEIIQGAWDWEQARCLQHSVLAA